MILPREPRKYLHQLAGIGIDPASFLAGTGYGWAAIDGLQPMETREVAGLIDLIAARTPRDFGLYCGDSLPLTRLGVFGHAMMNCATLRDMFDMWNRCSVVAGHPLTGSLTIKGQTWVCEMRARLPLGPDGLRFIAEASVAGFVRLCRECLQREDVLSAVEFPFPRPDSEAMAIYAGLPVHDLRFDALHLRMIGSLECLDLRVLQAEGDVLEVCERRCQEQMVAMRLAMPMHTRLEMLAMASERLPGAAEAAERLAVSKRTLFRQLAAEGTSFQTVLDQVRQRLAFRMLTSDSLNLKEIGWRLGFADSRSFRRKFSGWTGMGLSSWRNSQRSEI